MTDNKKDTREYQKCDCECPKCGERNSEMTCEPYDSNYDYEHRCLVCHNVWLSYSGMI